MALAVNPSDVIREGVKTKVLMLSATPVNNRFSDLRNQLALAYEGEPGNLAPKLRTGKDINEIFRRAQATFNAWSTLPPEARTPAAILGALFNSARSSPGYAERAAWLEEMDTFADKLRAPDSRTILPSSPATPGSRVRMRYPTGPR